MDVKDKNDSLPIDIENVSLNDFIEKGYGNLCDYLSKRYENISTDLTTNQQPNIFLFDDKDGQVNVFPDNKTLIVAFDGHIEVSYGVNPDTVCVGFKEHVNNFKPGDNITDAKLKYVRPKLLHDVRLCFNNPLSIDVVINALNEARDILHHRNKACKD